MCLVCNCGDFDSDHGDKRNIDLSDLTNAAIAQACSLGEIANRLTAALTLVVGPNAGNSTDDAVVVCKSVGVDDEMRYSLGVAYWASKADTGKALDGFRDFATARDVEQAAWKYLQNGGNVGLMHEPGTDGRGRACESYVYRGPDWHTTDVSGAEQVIKAGDWMLGVIWEPEIWPAVKSGLIRGYSWQGGCKRTTPTAEALAALRS